MKKTKRITNLTRRKWARRSKTIRKRNITCACIWIIDKLKKEKEKNEKGKEQKQNKDIYRTNRDKKKENEKKTKKEKRNQAVWTEIEHLNICQWG